MVNSDKNDPITQTEGNIQRLIEESKKDIDEGGDLKQQEDIIKRNIEAGVDATLSKITQYEEQIHNEEEKVKADFSKQLLQWKRLCKEHLGRIERIYQLFQKSFLTLGCALFLFVVDVGLSLSGFIPVQFVLAIYALRVIYIPLLFMSVAYFYEIFKRKSEIDEATTASCEASIGEIRFCQVAPPKFKVEEILEPRLLDTLTNGVGALVVRCSEVIPLVNQFYELFRDKAKWDITADEIEKSLKYFNVDVESAFEKIPLLPDVTANLADNEVLRERKVLQIVAGQIKFENVIVGFEVLNLLFQYYKGRQTKLEWDDIKNKDRQLGLVAKILYNSKHVDLDRTRVTLSALFEILKRTPEFDLNKIFTGCLLYQRICEYLDNYHKELLKNQINLRNVYSAKDIVHRINFLEDFKFNFINIFSSELEENLSIEPPEAYVKAILAILLNSDLSFKETVCHNASDDESVLILMVYLELLKRKRENREEFKISDLLIEHETLDELRSQLDSETEVIERFQTYRAALSNGRWFTDEIFLIRETLQNGIDKLDKHLEEGRKYKIVQKLIKNHFEDVSINTVDKAIDANLFSAYVILTHSAGGRIVNMVEKLSTANKDKSEIEETERKYGIQLRKNGKPKYHFEQYSKGTKIGIIDRSTPFSQFQEDFFNDLIKILDYEGRKLTKSDIMKLGVAILRINPSKYSFGMLPDMEKVQTKDLQVARKILRLANEYDYLNLPEKATLAIFDGKFDLLEIVNAQSVYDLLEHDEMDLSNYASFLKSEQLKNSLIEEINGLGLQNFKEAAIGIKKGIVNRGEMIALFNDVIEEEYVSQTGKQMRLVNLKKISFGLYESLAAISTLWDR